MLSQVYRFYLQNFPTRTPLNPPTHNTEKTCASNKFSCADGD
jgi:hypothetical protein